MRLALLSDIHGCPIALEAVLGDIQQQGGVDTYWVLGDLVDRGYDPLTVLERLTQLPNITFTYGNTDSYVLNRHRPRPTLAEALLDPSLFPRVLQIETGIAWIQGCMANTGWLDWLGSLPLETRLTLPDGTRLLGVHASPKCDDGLGFRPYMTDAEFEAQLGDCQADLVITGHTHVGLERRVNGVHVVNLGTIGMPVLPELRASYAILEADTNGYQLERHWVDYDREAVIEAFRQSSNPAKDYMMSFYAGQRRVIWERADAFDKT